MTYLRFVLSTRHPDSGVAEGLFGPAHTLRAAKHVSPEDRKSLESVLAWFERNLPTPGRFNRTASKGFYRRRTKGITWFRDTAHEHLSKMHELRRTLEAYGHSVDLIREDRIGYVVYEDPVQVVAEPFADTLTNTRG
jgi:hypothetical protein